MLPSHALGIIANTSFLEKKCACMQFDVMFTIYFNTQIFHNGQASNFKHGGWEKDFCCVCFISSFSRNSFIALTCH